MPEPIYTGAEWTFEKLEQITDAMERIALEELRLDYYPYRLEVISSEQMMDAYTSAGMPINYHHWSFGKHFLITQENYRRGRMGLAYEIVINCLSSDTLISTKDGIIPIGTIKPGARVWTGKTYETVTGVSNQKAKAIEITLSNGRKLLCTPNHRFPSVKEDGVQIVNAENLRVGDFLIGPEMSFDGGDYVDVSEFEYVPPYAGFGDRFAYQPYCSIPPVVDENLAELMGIIVGDGSIGHSMKRAFYIAVGHDSGGYEKHVIDLLKKVFDIDPHMYERPSPKYPDKTNKVVYVTHDEIKSFLDFCGLSRRSTHKDKMVPWSILISPASVRAAFLRGLFDTDGCVKVTKGVPGNALFSCYNQELGKGISALLDSLGIPNILRHVNNKHNNIHTVELVSTGPRKFAELVGSNHLYKLEKLNVLARRGSSKFNGDNSTISKIPSYYLNKHRGELPRSKPTRRAAVLNYVRDSEYLNEDWRFLEIVSLTPLGHEISVTDISITGEDNLFIAGGVLTHNSDPCIAYLMEENTMTMQALVIAHAAFGHNAFMKNNYLFKQWTHADAIIDYLAFARKYIAQCEERYGLEEIEGVLDACHALQSHGVHRYEHPKELSIEEEEQRQRERSRQRERYLNVLWSTIPKEAAKKKKEKPERFPREPQENILYFIEKHAPELPTWKREIVRIVRKIAQYFYPQRQTKVLNEGFASFTHYHIMNRLSEEGLITPGATQEFLHAHTNVIAQPDFAPINPYALGFNLFVDVKRICQHPTDEDRAWFPDIAGAPWLETVKFIAENFKDESAILQFLSPALIRRFKLFSLLDDDRKDEYEVTAIHNEDGYRRVRKILSEQYDIGLEEPDIEVRSVNRFGDRTLTLRHRMRNRRPLHAQDAIKTLYYTERLWGFPVELEVETESGTSRAWRVSGGELIPDEEPDAGPDTDGT